MTHDELLAKVDEDIRKEIGIEFGFEAIGFGKAKPITTVRQSQALLHKYGKDKARVIIRRYVSIRGKK